MIQEFLTADQFSILYDKRKALIEKANNLPHSFYIVENGQKWPAKLAGCKLDYCIAYSGNFKVEITWKLAERIANEEVKEID